VQRAQFRADGGGCVLVTHLVSPFGPTLRCGAWRGLDSGQSHSKIRMQLT